MTILLSMLWTMLLINLALIWVVLVKLCLRLKPLIYIIHALRL
jgi:hypothetical protein